MTCWLLAVGCAVVGVGVGPQVGALDMVSLGFDRVVTLW